MKTATLADMPRLIDRGRDDCTRRRTKLWDKPAPPFKMAIRGVRGGFAYAGIRRPAKSCRHFVVQRLRWRYQNESLGVVWRWAALG